MNLKFSDVGESVQTLSIKPLVIIEFNMVHWFSIMEAQYDIVNIKTCTLQFYHLLATSPLQR